MHGQLLATAPFVCCTGFESAGPCGPREAVPSRHMTHVGLGGGGGGGDHLLTI